MIEVATSPSAHLAFDALAWSCGMALGWAVYGWRFADKGVRAHLTPGYFIALACGAIPAAYLAGATPLLGTRALAHSVVGALAGAVIGVEIYKALNGIRVSTGAIFVAPFVLGLVIGRWGCLFAGLADGTYGRPTHLPWGVDLGDAIGRHPVQIYESAAMALFLCVYLLALARRAPWAMRHGFHVMVVCYAAQRFLWEFLKPYPTLIGPLNAFHFLCLGLIVYGCVFILAARARIGRAAA
jgi:hypothetical protein